MRERRIAVTNHAVERLRRRAGAAHLPDEEVRGLVAAAVNSGEEVPHYVDGQVRVLVNVLGVRVWAIVGRDTTGWTGPSWAGGRAVVTFLTVDQVRADRERLLRALSGGEQSAVTPSKKKA